MEQPAHSSKQKSPPPPPIKKQKQSKKDQNIISILLCVIPFSLVLFFELASLPSRYMIRYFYCTSNLYASKTF